MEKIWLNSYPEGVPAEINPDIYASLGDFFIKNCQRFAALPAFYNFGVCLTYQELLVLAEAFAAFLQQECHVKKGDRVAIMLPNLLQYPVVMFAVLLIGAIVVNVNPLYTSTELTHQVADAGAETIIVLENFAKTVEQSLAKTSIKNVIVTRIGDLLPKPKAFLLHVFLKFIKRKIPAWHIPQAVRFNDALARGRLLRYQAVPVDREDIAFLQYTGGTTGVAKGAMLTHRNLLANVAQAKAWLKDVFAVGKDIMVAPLPLYHIFSLTASCMVCVEIGAGVVLITNPRDIKGMIKAISQFKFTMMIGVNTLFHGLLDSPHFAQLNFSAFKLALGGGMSVHHATAEIWQKTTGVVLLEAYGLTETSPCVCINPSNLKTFNGSVGLPVSSTNVCVLNDKGEELPILQPGEFAIKGPQVMKGYWQNLAETNKVFTKDGWLLTGDIASIDEAGFVRILERKKDMILVSGFNVYPNEVEDVLTAIPGVSEAAVVGVPDEHSGEVVKAFVVKNNPQLTVDEIIRLCHQSLTGYKIPKHVEFCEVLPKTNVGKILRRELRA